jgi:hypothetical protein
MGYVGLDPAAADHLVGEFSAAARDLEAHAQTIDRLLAEAGFASGAPGTLRNVAAWAHYRARDLRGRIDKIVAGEQARAGAALPAGFHFSTRADAVAQAKYDADQMAKAIDDSNHVGLDEALAAVEYAASDPDYAGALFSALGPGRTRSLLKLVKGDDRTAVVTALALAAQHNKLAPHFLDLVKHPPKDRGITARGVADVLCTVVGAFSFVPPTTPRDAVATIAAKIAMRSVEDTIELPLAIAATPFAAACLLGNAHGTATNGTADRGAPGGFYDPGTPNPD